MKKALFLLLFTLLCAAAYFFLAGAPRADLDEGQATKTDAHATPRESEVDPTVPANPETDDRQQISERPSSQTMVSGRCVSGESGAPLADCSVSIYDWPQWSPESFGLKKARHWTCRSDADGRFTCAMAEARSKIVTLRAQCRGRVPTLVWDVAISLGSANQLPDTAVHIGAKITGTVRDAGEAAVSSYDFSLARKNQRLVGRSTEDGSFSLPGRVSPGRYLLQGERNRKLEEQTVEIPAGTDEYQLNLTIPVLPPGRVIAGRVIDRTAAPVPGAHVRVLEMDGLGSRLHRDEFFAITDRGGNFTLHDPQATPGDPTSLVIQPVAALGLRGMIEKTNWGQHDLRISLPGSIAATSTVRLHVTDGDTNARIESYRFRFYAADGENYSPGEKPNYSRGNRLHDGRSSDGKGMRVLTGVKPTHHFVCINPTDPAYSPSGPVKFAVPPGESITKSIELFKKSELQVSVRFPNGAPVHETKVELIRSPLRRAFRTIDHAWPVEDVYDYSGQQSLLYSVANSDANGIATLHAAPGSYVLRLIGPSHPSMVRQDVRVAPGRSDLTVQVDGGGTVHGQIEPLDAWRTYWPSPDEPAIDASKTRPQVFLITHDRRKIWPVLPNPPIAIDESGTFVATGVPPGRYLVRVVCRRPNFRHARITGPEFAIRPGEDREVQVTLPKIETAQLSGEVHRDGTALASTWLTLLDAPPKWSEGYLVQRPVRKLGQPLPVQIVTDEQGKFGPMIVRAGRYTLADHQGTVSHDEVTLAADQSLTKIFRMHRVKLKIRLTTPDGAVVASRPCNVLRRTEDGKFVNTRQVLKTSAEGELLLDRAPQFVFYLGFYPIDVHRPSKIAHRTEALRAPLDRTDATLDAVVKPLPLGAAKQPKKK